MLLLSLLAFRTKALSPPVGIVQEIKIGSPNNCLRQFIQRESGKVVVEPDGGKCFTDILRGIPDPNEQILHFRQVVVAEEGSINLIC